MRTLDIVECAEFLKVDRTTALKLANEGAIIGARIGRAWVFLEDDVVAYLREQAHMQTRARLEGNVDPAGRAEKVQNAIQRQFSITNERRPGRKARTPPQLPEPS